MFFDIRSATDRGYGKIGVQKENPMAYRYGSREQYELFPASIEEYVAKDNPVRVYDAFVEALDFQDLGIIVDDSQVGNAAYDPKSMLKLLVYSYSYGWRSSRKIERAVHHDVSFIWLMGGLKPDHKTIAEFRRNNKKAIAGIIKSCARMCIKLDVMDGNVLFVDGSKVRADANIKQSWDKDKCAKQLKKLDERIEELLEESERVDREESEEASHVKMSKDLADARVLKERVRGILKELEETERPSINTVDPECGRMNLYNRTDAGYNVQSVVDEKHGLIVNMDVTGENNDINQLSSQVFQAEEVTGKRCVTAVADEGYTNVEELEELEKKGITPITPPRKKRKEQEGLEYDEANDEYVCPAGKRLVKRGKSKDGKLYIYKITGSTTCRDCPIKCTESKNGKTVARLVKELERQRYEDIYREEGSQRLYRLRKEKVEHPFGHIKRNLGVKAFLLRGIEGAKAEISLLGSCFNVRRLITIFGTGTLLEKFAALGT
jgi:transposase